MADVLFQAFDNADVAVVVAVDHGDRVERAYVNEAAARLTGYSREELAEIPWLALNPPRAQTEIERIRASAFAGGAPPSSIVTEILAKDGRRVPVHIGLAAARLGDKPATVAFVQDRTEALAAETALAASEARFRQLAEAAPDTIVVISEGRLVYANPNAVRVLGFEDMADCIARPLADLVVPEEVPAMRERLGRVSRGERLPPTEYRGRRKDGSIVVMEISSVATTYAGKPAIVGFGRDVTERKALLQRVLRQDRLAAVGTLAAGVAHEINNPLAYALLNLQMLRLRAGASTAAGSAEARHLDQALEGLERVRRIVLDLLSFARPSEDVVELVDVAQVLGSAVRLARTSTGGTARIDVDVDGLPPARTNGARLGQVLLNVLVNALQALEDRTDGRVRVTGAARGDRLRLEVRDDGPGMPPAVLEQVFDAFFTTKPPGRGTGLGLTVSQSIVTSLGGTLDVSCPEGGGTLVCVEIPLRPLREAPRAERRARVLVVDDEPAVAGALTAFLEDDHDAVACNDPESARQLLSGDEDWDVVLCDVRMPRMSGPELFERVRARRPDVARRFVFLTGGVLDGNDARIAARHEVPVIGKPVDMDELLGVIRVVAEGRAGGG